MSRKLRLLAVSCFALVELLAAAPSCTAEPVNLSRYVLRVDTAFLVPIDQTVLEAFCRDQDGCEFLLTRTLSTDNVATTRAVGTRLFLSTNNAVWFSTGAVNGTDGNGTLEVPLAVNSCWVVDDGGSQDFTIGFGLYSEGGSQICTLVVID